MKKTLTLILSITVASLFAQIQPGSFIHEGIERDYLVYLPSNYVSGDQLPLVFNLHGYTSTAAEQYLYSEMTEVADTGNFIICYPNGTDNVNTIGKGWNVGFPFASQTADDVSFLSDLIDTLHVQFGINLNRVYSCGMSNGGYMSYKLACELTDRVQAVASVAGSIVPDQASDCTPSNTIPVMQIHGTADPTVSYNGSGFGIPIEGLVTQWVDHNDCTNSPDTTFITDTNTSDFSTAQLIAYTDCDTDREVHFYKIMGGEHTWPGVGFSIGVTNKDIHASVEIWRFFNKYGEDIITNTKELELNSTITLHPNPVGDHLFINSAGEEIQNVRLFNGLGQIVFTKNGINNDTYNLKMGHLPKGSYFVETQTDKDITTRQIVKQ